MGKFLVEKLLVSCPKLEILYLLVRSQKEKSMDQRLDSYFEEPVNWAKNQKLYIQLPI